MKRLLFFAVMISPVILTGQKKEDILSIQRDVANLQDQVKQLQKSQDDKMAALQALVQQSVDASNHLVAGLTALQRDVDAKLNDQQSKLVAPVAMLGSKVEQMADNFGTVATNVQELVRRMGSLDSKLTDISNAIRTLQTPVPPPQPPVTSQNQVPQVSAETTYSNAFRDYQTGKYELALGEFIGYVKDFPTTADAPNAQYYIGYIYFNNEQWADAAKAFDDVLGKFPENPKSPDALYYKAVSMQKNHQNTDAAKAYREFIQRYPRNDRIPQAHTNLRALGMESSSGAKKQHK
jgi:tol-pal system protein YbgF